MNYGVTFPMMCKSAVTGATANPLFKRLAETTGEAPSWNFNKYLVSRDGRTTVHFSAQDKPLHGDLEAANQRALGVGGG